ncbi:MAG: HEAT repeat domain-containing protein [Okeania sp. SIO2C2]|uniref:HEAT repeat domain-containing protein n=1 Tax=Okeania sp. SIO2C2 TaxID=2607787 RepID=UPI0013BC08A6|nr:HEAT repeat domain-containing protein [Okeania sp. SIO2C2]NEP89025.1 HEAT repeat domain-containing protein [Okeania sp. SIO2C2]
MSNLLEQAKTASQEKNWSLVNQYLQQFLLASQKTCVDWLENADLDVVLDLAITVLKNGDFQERWDIYKLFKQIGKPAIAPLIEMVQDEDLDLERRWFVARILADFNSEEVREALKNIIISSEAEDLQEIAADTLAVLGDSAVDILTDLLTKADSRLLATKALAKINSPSTITPLLTVVKDGDDEVRKNAISALSNYHDSRLPFVLISALKDTAAKVRKEAVIGLSTYANLDEQLGVVELLQPLLWDINFEVCQQVAIAIGKIGTNTAATALFELLQTTNVPVFLKLDAVRALSWVETQVSVEYLQSLLEDNLLVAVEYQPQIVNEIITALGKIERQELKPKATEILIEFLRSNNSVLESVRVKNSLVLALGYLGDIRALDYLIQLLEENDASVRLHCIAALKQLDSERAYQQLIYLSQKANIKSELKTGIATAIAEWNY